MVNADTKPAENAPPKIWDVAIIGSGPAGLTAAIYTVRSALSTIVLAGVRWGGQLMLTTEVENFPGFPQGIEGPELMLSIRQQAERLGVKLIEADVAQVNFKSTPFILTTAQGEFHSRSVIVATGANSNWIGLPSEQKYIGHGVSSCAPCDAAFFKDKKVAVVGGGDSAMEEALVLAKFASQVIIVHRRSEFRASQIMQDRVLSHPKIAVVWDTQVTEVIGNQKVTGLKMATAASSHQATLLKSNQAIKLNPTILSQKPESLIWQMPTDGLFVAIGHTPSTQIFSGQVDLDEKGYIKTTGTQTNIPGIFVAGDVQDFRYRQAVTAAGFGCMAALDAEKWLHAS